MVKRDFSRVFERMKTDRRMYLRQVKEQLAADLTLVLQHPDILDRSKDSKDLTPWQKEVLSARLEILRELERRGTEGSIYAAAAQLERLANSKSLSPELREVVRIANPRQSSWKGIKGLSASTLMRWRAMLDAGESLAPIEDRKKPLPKWARPLLKILLEQDTPAFYCAVREVKRAGIECNKKTARRFIAEMAERIRAESTSGG
ncbi:MAG: hypothetical protein IH614_17060 [Desulfuromonadales bacterium]|nr:hypothetical protein [Desulfuromonadales bacterium]